MKRYIVLSVILYSYGCLHSTADDPLITDLDATLQSIDTIEGYGPVRSLYGLERFLSLVDDVLSSAQCPTDAPSSETPSSETLLSKALSLAHTIAQKIYTQNAYRDGSRRSRVYALAHQRLTKILRKTSQGRLLLEILAQQLPIVDENYELASTSSQR